MNGQLNRTDALLSENIIDIRYYWSVLMQNKWWILALVLTASVLAALVASKISPLYRATTTVLIESNESNIVSIEGVYGMNTRAKEYYLTQFEILKSNELAELLVERLNLRTHPEFDPRQQQPFDWRNEIPSQLAFLQEWFPKEEVVLTDAMVHARVMAKVSKAIIVEPVNNTQLVKINFESHDPALAARAANEMAEVYIENNMEARLQMTKKAAGWLTGRLEELSTKLKASEQRLQDYREKETLVDVSGVDSLNSKELNELTLRYVAASDTRAQAQNPIDQIRAMGPNPSVDQLLELPAILQHDLVRALKQRDSEASMKVADLSKRYGPGHPAMVSARTEAEEARQELTSQVMRAARGFESNFRAARENERAIAAQIAVAKKDAQSISRKEFRLHELEREVEANRQLYDMFFTRAKETGEAGGLQAAHARVVDPALPPRVPVAPKKGLIVLMALAGSFALGILLAFVRDGLDNTVKTTDDVEEKLRIRLLGFLPKTRVRGRNRPMEGFLSSNFSHFAEAVRSLRTGIKLANIDHPLKVILVTSTVPGEGKSTVSLNAAEALGQMEKVLLIEADLRKPALGRALGIPRDVPGLTDLVTDYADLNSCITEMPAHGIDVIVAGKPPANPQELLSSENFYMVLERLKMHYDRIIIDTPPVHPVSDALVLSSVVDGVIFVVKAGDTPTSLVARTLKRLRDVRAPIMGAVLNQVDISKNRYSEYYGGEYHSFGNRFSLPKSDRKKIANLAQ